MDRKNIPGWTIFILALIVIVETVLIIGAFSSEDNVLRLNAKIDHLEEVAINYCMLSNNQARILQASDVALIALHRDSFIIHDCSKIAD